MPNTPVRAAAEGMPSYPQKRRWIVFFRKLPMPWHSRAGTEPAEPSKPVESFMNQHVNRRALGPAAAAFASISIVPAQAFAAQQEYAVARVNRLACELAGAMDEWMADLAIDGVPDLWKAHIYPASHTNHPVAFEHLGAAGEDMAPQKPLSKVAELESVFQAEWQKHRDMLPTHDAAERRYFEERAELTRPVKREPTREEIDALRKMTVDELRHANLGASTSEYDEAIRNYNKAEAAARRRSGFTKIDREFQRQMDRVSKIANRLLRCPARSLDDLAIKARVNRVWEIEGDDIGYIMADIARVARREA